MTEMKYNKDTSFALVASLLGGFSKMMTSIFIPFTVKKCVDGISKHPIYED
jgi:hypothetical protein